MMRLIHGLLVLVLLFAGPARGAIYLVNFTTDNAPGTITGQIVTTCNNCPLNQSDITAWNFALNGAHSMSSTDGNSKITLEAPFVTPASPLFATPGGIIFDPTTKPQGSTLIFGDPNDPASGPGLVFDAQEVMSIQYTDLTPEGRRGLFADSLGQAPLEIATRAPEPSTWAMMLMGFAAMAFAAVRRRRIV